MRVNSFDHVPSSMLNRRPWDGQMVVGGVLVAIAAHLLLPLAVALGASLLAATGMADAAPDSYIEERVVEARFVQLGEKRDPDRLPSRVVPRKSTAPDDRTVVSKKMDPQPPEKPPEPKPERPEVDDLLRLGDRAQDFAEIADHEREGDPEGVEFGTETEAQAGDIYAGKLKAFFQRGWTVPTTLQDPSKLVVVTSIEITRDLKVGSWEIEQGSGDPLFDQSVEDRLQQLQSLGTTLPEPPPEVADRYLGKQIMFRFKGDNFE